MAECHEPKDVVSRQKLRLQLEILFEDVGDVFGHGVGAVDMIEVDGHQVEELFLVPAPFVFFPLFLGDEVEFGALV